MCVDGGVAMANILSRKEIFYLTMESTHFDLRLYGVGPLR